MTKKNETGEVFRIDEINGDDENKSDLKSGLLEADEKEKNLDTDSGHDSDSKQSAKCCWATDSPQRADDKTFIEDYPTDEGNNLVITEVESESRVHARWKEDKLESQNPSVENHFVKSLEEDRKANEVYDLSEQTDERINNVNENSNNSNNTDLVATIADRVDELDVHGIDKGFVSSSETDGASSGQQRWTLEERRQIVEKERNRLAFWRKKNDSAAVIQKSWRK